jgi:hypothetical protein
MAPRPKSSARLPAHVPLGASVRVACMGCRKATTLSLPGIEPYPGAAFGEEGWSVLNEPEEGQLVFACRTCFEAEMDAPDSSIKGQG